MNERVTSVTGARLRIASTRATSSGASNGCYWPKVATGRCRGLGPWTAKLRKTAIRSRTGKGSWAKGERHKFTMTWSLDPSAPNEVQHQLSRFTITWAAR